jgi:hypothetical protein
LRKPVYKRRTPMSNTSMFLHGEWSDPNDLLFRTYLRKPLIIEAVQLDGEFTIATKDGLLRGKEGDYIVRDTDGRISACSEEDFLAANKRWYYYVREHNPFLEGSGEYQEIIQSLARLSERMRESQAKEAEDRGEELKW